MSLQITPELVEQIVQAIAPEATPHQAPDRQPRYTLDRPVQIHVRDGGLVRPVQVHCRNLSEGGMGLIRSERMGLDEPFVAELPVGDGRPVHALCSVVYWEPQKDGNFGIGARFHRLLQAEETTHLKRTLNLAAADAADALCYRPVRLAS